MKTVDEVFKCFYRVDGIYHTNILKVIDYDNPIECKILNQVLLKLLADVEVLFAIDDETKDNSTAFIYYRKNDYILSEYIFLEEEKFEYDVALCGWLFPEKRDLSKNEKLEFILALDNHISDKKLPLFISGCKMIELKDIRNKKKIELKEFQIKVIEGLAFFWRYVYVIIMFGSYLLLQYYGEKKIGMIVATSLLLFYCLYFYIGLKLHIKHVFVVLQKNLKKEVDYKDFSFEQLNQKRQFQFLFILGLLGLIGLIAIILLA